MLKTESESLENSAQNTPISQPKNEEIATPKQPENEADLEAKIEEISPTLETMRSEEKLDGAVEFLHEYPDATDEELAGFLDLRRPASARFWRLKAMEIIESRILVQTNQKRTTDPLENSRETDARMESVSLPENHQKVTHQNSGETQKIDAPHKQENRQQIRYTPVQAALLSCCTKKGITAADIRAALKEGKLEKKADGKLSKNAVETWAKTYQRVADAVVGN